MDEVALPLAISLHSEFGLHPVALPRRRVTRAFTWPVGRALAAGTSPAQAASAARPMALAMRQMLPGQVHHTASGVPAAVQASPHRLQAPGSRSRI
jgi:hypothetical protein